MNPGWLLNVDDNLDDALLFRHACKKGAARFELWNASHGGEAIACLEKAQNERGRLPDLMLLDLSMPVMTGFEVLEHVRNGGTQALKIIVFTSSENASDIEGAYQRGADYYLSKPADITNLVSLVRCIDAALMSRCPHPWECLHQFPTFKLSSLRGG